jgi:predicted nuclease of predicted toxin-antitoxin system
MRFLVDTNLPPALAVWLIERGHDAQHAAHVIDAQADDRAIWNLAVSTEAIVITKDADYLDLAARIGGARVVLLRCGNLRLAPFRLWIDARWPSVEALLDFGETTIELR